jgi:hypothetical protein
MRSGLLLFLHAMKSSLLCLQNVKIPKVIQFLFLFIYLFIYLCIYLFIYLFIYLLLTVYFWLMYVEVRLYSCTFVALLLLALGVFWSTVWYVFGALHTIFWPLPHVRTEKNMLSAH